MGGFLGDKPSSPITGINVTPLVDITLVLLIIFMVTAKLVVSRAMPMDLPKAATAGEVQTVYSVQLRADGGMFVNAAPVATDQELFKSAKKALKSEVETRAVVHADGKVPHERVMRALDVLRQAGMTKVAFATEPGPSVNADVEVEQTP
jgi:biopolymer transport protein TolR